MHGLHERRAAEAAVGFLFRNEISSTRLRLMAIVVVCSKCRARFQVSEKFAGQKGPCPKCKNEITIPDKSQEVKIHAPETFGPKDAKGRAVLKPIFREETKWNPVAAGVIGGIVLLCFILAFVVGGIGFEKVTSDRGKDYQEANAIGYASMILGSLLLGGALGIGGYTLVRDSELEPYRGKELWIRVAVCAVGYTALWGVVWLVKLLLPGLYIDSNVVATSIALIAMLAIGGGIGHFSFDIEYTNGLLHYGMFLIVTVLMRLTMGSWVV